MGAREDVAAPSAVDGVVRVPVEKGGRPVVVPVVPVAVAVAVPEVLLSGMSLAPSVYSASRLIMSRLASNLQFLFLHRRSLLRTCTRNLRNRPPDQSRL